MDIFSVAGSPNELRLMLMELIQKVLVVNLVVISAVTLLVCLSNLLLNVLAGGDGRGPRRPRPEAQAARPRRIKSSEEGGGRGTSEGAGPGAGSQNKSLSALFVLTSDSFPSHRSATAAGAMVSSRPRAS